MSDDLSAGTAHVVLRDSPIHGRGGFARVALAVGARVIEYVGERIDKAESLRRCQQGNAAIFILNDTTDLDGSVSWNPARWLNHSCAPNTDAELLDRRIWIVANQPIAAGTELTFDYGYDLADYREHPCRCGSPECAGYILAAPLAERLRARSRSAMQ